VSTKTRLLGGALRSLGVAFALIAPTAAMACPTCVEGDDASRRPAVGETSVWSSAVTVDAWRDRLGDGVDAQRLDSVRVTPAVTARVAETVHVVVAAPFSWRRLVLESGGVELATATALGDVETGAVFTPQSAGPRGWSSAAMRWPTGPEVRANGAPIAHDAQPGAGAFVAIVGGGVGRTWTPSARGATPGIEAAVHVFAPLATLREELPGAAASVDAVPLLGFARDFRVELGVWARGDLASREDGQPVPDTGGLALGVSPGLSYAGPTGLRVGLRGIVPLVHVVPGVLERGPGAAITVGYARTGRAANEPAPALVAQVAP
jgi:hypothetical protein